MTEANVLPVPPTLIEESERYDMIINEYIHYGITDSERGYSIYINISNIVNRNRYPERRKMHLRLIDVVDILREWIVTSWPFLNGESTCCWMAEGFSNPYLYIPLNKFPCKDSSSKDDTVSGREASSRM